MSLPVPSPASQPADLRCADTDRDQVADLLAVAYSEGRLTREEHDDRVAAAWRARTFGELAPLVADLPTQQPLPAVAGSRALVDPTHQTPGDDRIVSVLGDVSRQGAWRLRRRTTGYVVLGDVDLDLRDAVFEADECVVEVNVVLGDLVIRLPEGVALRDETTTVLGEVKLRGMATSSPGGPTVVLRGTVVLGDVKVRGPLAGGGSRWRGRRR